MNILDILRMQPQNPYGATSPAPTMPNKLGEAIQNRWTEINTPQPVKPMTQQEAIDAALGIAPLGMIAYHGSKIKELSELNPKKSFGRLGVSWVSPSKDFAKKYAGKEGIVYKVDLNEGKNFDFSNSENLNLLREKAKNIEYHDPVRGFTTLDKRVPETSSYYSAEDPMLFNLIKKLGYDTVSVTENGVKNIGVFNPKKNAKIIK